MFIDVDVTKRLGSQLRMAVDMQRQARDLLHYLKAVMDQQVSGSSYAQVEATFGLAVGMGQTVYNLVTGAVTDLEGASIGQLCSWMG